MVPTVVTCLLVRPRVILVTTTVLLTKLIVVFELPALVSTRPQTNGSRGHGLGGPPPVVSRPVGPVVVLTRLRRRRPGVVGRRQSPQGDGRVVVGDKSPARREDPPATPAADDALVEVAPGQRVVSVGAHGPTLQVTGESTTVFLGVGQDATPPPPPQGPRPPVSYTNSLREILTHYP